MDSEDSGPFSLTQPLGDGGGYPVSSASVANQYHVWATAGTSSNIGGSSTTTLPTHFSPVSPSGHGLYTDHLTLHPSQASVGLVQGDYHTPTTDRLTQGESYHSTGGADGGGRHATNQSDYHDHLVAQDRHLGLDSYHHISAPSSSSSSSSSTQQQDRLGVSSDYHSGQSGERLAQSDYHSGQQSSRLGRNDYHSTQQPDRLAQTDYQSSDRLGQSDYHSTQQTDRLGQPDYHVASQSDRLGQLDYSSGQSERLQTSLTKQEYHTIGGDQLGQSSSLYHPGQGGQQTSTFHSGQAAERSLAAQADYHSAQVDLEAVSMHTDFDRRHLDVSLLPKDLVDSSQRGSALDYLTSQTSRDTLASLHRDIVGLQREIDLSVGQTISPPQRSAPGDLASTSYSLDPASLPRDLSPYSQRDLDRAMLSASEVVVGQVADSGSHGTAGGITIHPQDLAGINLTATSRDLVDMSSLTRSSGGRDDMGRSRDVIHRPRDIQRALEVLGSLESSTASVDLTLNGGSSTKSSSRSYPSTSRLATSSKRQTVTTTQTVDIRVQNPLPVVASNANGSSSAGVSFFPLATSRDPLNIMAAADPTATGGSSRHITSSDFSRQQTGEMSRLRRELTAPYTDLSLHHSMLTPAGSVSVPAFKSSVDSVFNAHGDQLICNDALTSSRERLYEMMKQQQFCDAVLGTSLHSVKVHKAVLCSASAYLCGVLSQTCMGKSGGRILTVQFKADIPASSLSAFIDYIYQGRIKLSVKSVRDLNVMARCLHMESLKKTSEEMLVTLGMSNDTDLSIPELILLETLVDKLDKECTASFPDPAPDPAPSPPTCHVGVATDSALFTPSVADGSCQTDEVPTCSCSTGAIDLRSGGSSLRVGSVGTLSLAVKGGGVNITGECEKALTSMESKSAVCAAAVTTAATSVTMVKPHHKKHLASQASRVKLEVTTAPVTSTVSPSPPPPSRALPATTATSQPMRLSIDTESHGNGTVRSATPTPSSAQAASKSVTGKHKKRTSTPTSSLSPSLPSPSSNTVLPGQTARPIYHSYGTRAASRTPTKNLDSASPQTHFSSKYNPYAKESFSTGEVESLRDCSGDSASDAQIQMAKHRGRTKKGRIAAALSEAFKKSPQNLDSEKLDDQNGRRENVTIEGGPSQQPSSLAMDARLPSTGTTTSTTTALTEAKRSAPRAYRKRLIQSVVSSQSMLAKRQASEDAADGDRMGSSAVCDDDIKHLLPSQICELECKDEGEQGRSDSTEQLRETLHSPITAKRKKKGKARRMLLSSPSGSGGVRVRAPPKKRAKMELQLEQLMREEMEEEEEEEEVAASGGSTAPKVLDQSAMADSGGAECAGQQQASGSSTRIKMPSTKPGKRARWIKKDQMSPLMIALNQKAAGVSDGDCVYTCSLCNNEFLLPKRCLSHILLTHKMAEGDVVDSILVRKRAEADKCAEEDSISENLVCDICGYRSRENTTYYLHYHKYFKHGVPLPKGWSVYTCDLCGKELFTKFQLKDHKRTHAEKTPFVCEICGSGFQSRSNLHSHVFHRHKDEKKHSCDKCDRTFKTRTQLAVHERTHTGVRPFGCPQCSYRSTTRGNMRLHLVNRHKITNTQAHDIMRDMKPDVDVSLKPAWQNVSSDSGGEKKSPSKRKSASHSSSKGKKDKDVEGADLLPTSFTEPHSNQGKMTGLTEASTMEHTSGTFTVDLPSTSAEQVQQGDHEMIKQEQISVGSSVMRVMLQGDGDGSMVTLQAAEGFPAGTGVGVCSSETTAVTFLPTGLENMFHQPPTELSGVTPAVPSTAAATLIVPDNFLLQQQAQAFQQAHKNLYAQPQPFTSFVVGTTPTLQTFTPSDLVVPATTLNPDEGVSAGGGSGGGVVDLADMGMGVMDSSLVDGSLRQGALAPATDVGLQASGSCAPTASTSSSGATSQQGAEVQLYMQHSPISPAPPVSPNPVYVAVTPTPQPLAKQHTDTQPTVAVAAATGGNILVDQMQQGQPLHQYDASLLQAYYPGQFYSQNY